MPYGAGEREMIRAGNTVTELAEHLQSAGYALSDLTMEMRWNDDGTEFWFHFVDCRGGGYVYVGAVTHSYPSREALVQEIGAMRQSYLPSRPV